MLIGLDLLYDELSEEDFKLDIDDLEAGGEAIPPESS